MRGSQTDGTRDIILGAGLAGLSAARLLHEAGRQDWLLVEREVRVGGHARSMVVDGYVFDFGPHILFARDPLIADQIRALLADNFRAQQRRAFIYHERYDTFTRFPFQAHLHGLPIPLVRACLTDLVRAREREAAGSPPPKNYEEWMRATFGDTIVETLMIPYAKKLWTVDPSAMDFRWIERRVPVPDVDRIIGGALTDDVAEIGATADFWYPTDGGIEALPAALARGLDRIMLGSTVTTIDFERRTVVVDGQQLAYRHLVYTLPLASLPDLVRGVPPAIAEACRSLQAQGILNVNLGVARPGISDMHWIYFYDERSPFHRISFPGTFSPNNVPEGKSSVSTEISFRLGTNLDHAAAVDATVESLVRARILASPDEVELVHVEEIAPAYVIYDLEHEANVQAIRTWLRAQGVMTAGRFGAWEYLNMDEAMSSGRLAAAEILAAETTMGSERAALRERG